MKKILLLLVLAAVGMGFSARAQQSVTATLTVSDMELAGAPDTWTYDGFNFSVLKNGGSTAPAYNSGGGDLRLYAKNTIEISAEYTITKMVFNISTAGKKRLTVISADNGVIAEQAKGDETVTWTGETSNVTLTVGEKSVYGSDGETKAGQFDFSSIEVTYTAGGDTPVPTYPATLNIIGNVNGSNWNPSNGIAMTKGKNAWIYTIDKVEIGEEADGKGYFSFCENLSDNWDGLGTRYGATEKDVAPVLNAINAIAEGQNSFMVVPGVYDIALDLKAMTMEIAKIEPKKYTLPFTAPLTSQDSFDEFTIDNVVMGEALSFVWSYGGTNYGAKASSFLSNVNHDAESWLISPVIDMTGAEDVTMIFDHVCNKYPDLEFAKTHSTLWAREEGGQWQQVEIPEYSTNTNWTFVSSGEISLKAFAGKKAQIAFKYVAENGQGGTWEVKNISIESKSATIVTPDPEYPATLYVLGNVNGSNWNPSNGVAMTPGSEAWIFSAEAVAIGEEYNGNGYFSFCEKLSDNWEGLGHRYGATESDYAPVLNAVSDIVEGQNSFMVEKGTYDIVVDLKTMKMEIAKVNGPVVPDETKTVTFDFTNDENNGKYLGITISDATYTPDGNTGNSYINIESMSNDGVDIAFAKVTSTASATRVYKTAAGVTDVRFYKNNIFTISAPAGYYITAVSFASTGASYLKFEPVDEADGTFAAFDTAAKTRTFTAAKDKTLTGVTFGNATSTCRIQNITVTLAKNAGAPVVDAPDALYILGNVEGQNWNTAAGVAMTKDGATFTSPVFVIDDANGGNGYICLVTVTGASWDDVNQGTRYGAATADQPVEFNGEESAAVALTTYAGGNAGNSQSFMVPAGTYIAVAVFSNEGNTLTLTKKTDGIDSVAAGGDDSAEYYTLQGVRVEKPATGIYVRLSNGKATKVLVK